jgi:hypothetical protein
MKVTVSNIKYNILTVSDLESVIKKHCLISDFIQFPLYLHDLIQSRIDMNMNSHCLGAKTLKSKGRILQGIFKYRSKYQIDYWLIRGHSKEIAEGYISDLQTTNANKYVKKRKNNPNKYDGLYSNQLKYWLNKGYGNSDARLKLKERQTTFSLERCIERYGEIEGRRVFNNRQEKWIDTLNNKSDEELTDIKARKLIKFCTASKESLKVFNKTLDYLESKDIEYYIGVDGNKEYFLYNKALSKIFYYDLTIPKLKIIIEYNGIKWHPKEGCDTVWNPPFPINRQEQLKNDKDKMQTAIDNGFDVLVLWSDTDLNINQTLCFDYVCKKNI